MTGEATGLHAVLETLNAHYTFDGRGRIDGARDGGVLPRFVLGRAEAGCVWRFRADLPADRVAALARLAGREPGADFNGELPAPPERLAAIERLLADPAEPADPARGDASARPSARARRTPVLRGTVVVGELWRID